MQVRNLLNCFFVPFVLKSSTTTVTSVAREDPRLGRFRRYTRPDQLPVLAGRREINGYPQRVPYAVRGGTCKSFDF